MYVTIFSAAFELWYADPQQFCDIPHMICRYQHLQIFLVKAELVMWKFIDFLFKQSEITVVPKIWYESEWPLRNEDIASLQTTL